GSPSSIYSPPEITSRAPASHFRGRGADSGKRAPRMRVVLTPRYFVMAAMKQRLLTPGPTPVPADTLLELARPMVYHRTPEARAVLGEVVAGLKQVFYTQAPVVPLTCSGTGGLEAALVSTVPPGGKAICLVAGKFGERWRTICK